MRDPRLADNAFDFPAQINPDTDLVLRTVRAATPIRPEDLAARTPGEIVKLQAYVLAGPGGAVTAPLSGSSCIWYRCAFVPVPTFGQGTAYLPEIGSSDTRLIQGTGEGVVREKMNASEEISAAPFAVGEVGGPQLLVDPHVADVDIEQRTSLEWWQGEHGVSRAAEIEWLLAPGTPVFVVGRVGPDGRLTGDRDAALLISTRSEDGVLERCHREAGRHQLNSFVVGAAKVSATSRRGLRIFLIALVAVLVIFVVALFAL